MAIRTAYGAKQDVGRAIASGEIPQGSIIITKESGTDGELLFYDPSGNLKTVAAKSKFESMEEATQWIQAYDCVGQFLSIKVDGTYGMYLVQEGNRISPTDSVPYVEEYKTHLEFPNMGNTYCVYFASEENDGNGYMYRWDQEASKYFRPYDSFDEIEEISGGFAGTTN